MRPQGRPPTLTADQHATIKQLYYHGRAPNGKPYTMPMIARLYRVSAVTISNVLNNRTPAKEPEQ